MVHAFQIKLNQDHLAQVNHAEWYILFQCSPNVCVTLSVLRITVNFLPFFSQPPIFALIIRADTSNLFAQFGCKLAAYRRIAPKCYAF